MFCDEVQVHFIAGKGGDGCMAFRREKYIAKGGPNGGNGGNGGSIFLRADENINTLAEFNAHRIFRGETGDKGQGKECAGRTGADLFLPVPVGTIIFDEKKKKILGDLKNNGDLFVVARGGRGGYGNAHFKSSTRRAPRFAEKGEPGEEKKCTLELKLVADVGIIGLPSVGKSTLISRISNARPKIAEYHFTTLIPNLGLVTMKQFGGSLQQSFLACDLPGLIEGAHEGKGLGIQFLKHVARNRILVHILDISSTDPSHDFKTINAEIYAFDRKLKKKPMIVAFNKIDMMNDKEVATVVSAFKKKNRKIKEVFVFSGVTGKGLKELMFAVWNLLKSEKDKDKELAAAPVEEFKVFRPDMEKTGQQFEIKLLPKAAGSARGQKLWEVTGPRIEQIVVMTNFNNSEALARVYDVLEKMSIHKELRRAGAKFGDEIEIRGQRFLFRWE